MNLENEMINLLKERRNSHKLNKKIRSRKERAAHLIQLGLIFSILGLEEEEQDLLLGIVSEYFKLNDKQKELYFIKGREIRREIKREIEKGGEENETESVR